MDPDASLEIGRDVFKRLGDCTAAEIEGAIRLVARRRIDRAWIDEQAAGPDQGELTIGRRFFENVTEGERDLIAYWQMVKLVEEERMRLRNQRGSAEVEDERSGGVMAAETLIDQALGRVLAVASLGPGDQISLTREQALVWAIYLRVIERHRGLASDQDVERSIDAARAGGIPAEEITAAISAADRPQAREET